MINYMSLHDTRVHIPTITANVLFLELFGPFYILNT